MTGKTDQELVEASLGGSHEAFGELVRRYQRMVEAAVVGAAGRGDVDDVVQDTFVTAWRTLDRLRDVTVLRAWLYGIARNLARKARRDSLRTEPADAVETVDATDATPFDTVAEQERDRDVATALARLPRRYREPLVLFYYEHCTVKEVAAALAMREDAAMQRLSRGRRKLGEALAARIEVALESKVSRAALVAGVLALLPVRSASAAAAPLAGAVATTFATRLSTVGTAIASQWRVIGATLGTAAAIAIVIIASSKSEAVAARSAARASSTSPAQPANTPELSTPAELRDEPYRPPMPDLPPDRADAVYANLSVASDDPVESCTRGARGLIQWFFDPDAMVMIDGKEYWQPNEDIAKFADEVGRRIGETCAIGKWPEQYVRCEGTPEELRDGNVNCYPYDHFADRE